MFLPRTTLQYLNLTGDGGQHHWRAMSTASLGPPHARVGASGGAERSARAMAGPDCILRAFRRCRGRGGLMAAALRARLGQQDAPRL